jgi:hypothetical protein
MVEKNMDGTFTRALLKQGYAETTEEAKNIAIGIHGEYQELGDIEEAFLDNGIDLDLIIDYLHQFGE